MADQFREKAQELQERAKDAMGNKGDGEKHGGDEQGSLKDRAKRTGKKAKEEADDYRRQNRDRD
ncbi:hypothetical protein [Streptomyces johnsoniae]|uniref:CsbD family protein n=1 Tax=Streptomyces johnsoniae TaxID=3075532 RepID=A0ABU2S0Z8_9ACTN|nr:hypothetical protein [Streptomyces sp. DSM 41886]MDT0441755.1 hypothetical protein [Streptomyces sp. DSM 41886]